MSKWKKISDNNYRLMIGNYIITISDWGFSNENGLSATVTREGYNHRKYLGTFDVENAKYHAVKFFLDVIIKEQSIIKKALYEINEFIRLEYHSCKDYDC